MKSQKFLEKDQVGAIVALHNNNLSQRQIAQQLNIAQSTVNMWIQRYKSEGSKYTPRPKARMGRPRKTGKRTNNILKREIELQPTLSAKELIVMHPELLSNVSERTIQRRLQLDLGLPSRQAAKKPLLTKKMKKARMDFCKAHLHWTEEDWKQVLFSDESSFLTIRSRTKGVRRPVGSNRFDPKYTVKTVKHPPSVMVWGCFSSYGRGNLYFLPKNATMNGQRYLEMLKEKLPTSMTVHNTSIFQHDGAPCHRSKIVSNWLKTNKYRVLEWPGNSPDLNPIENLWQIIKNKLEAHDTNSLPTLIEKIKLVWCLEISVDLCQNLVASMPNRIKMVIANKGEMTKY